jgi:hypothetical protein
MDFETSINGRFVNSHGGDGIVIATATGSTAYASPAAVPSSSRTSTCGCWRPSALTP